MKKQLNYADIIKEVLILTGAVAIIAAAVYFFLVPSHTSVSSISGLGIVLSNFVPLPLSAITMILNVVLLIIGFITCGREFGVKTVYIGDSAGYWKQWRDSELQSPFRQRFLSVWDSNLYSRPRSV